MSLLTNPGRFKLMMMDSLESIVSSAQTMEFDLYQIARSACSNRKIC